MMPFSGQVSAFGRIVIALQLNKHCLQTSVQYWPFIEDFGDTLTIYAVHL